MGLDCTTRDGTSDSSDSKELKVYFLPRTTLPLGLANNESDDKSHVKAEFLEGGDMRGNQMVLEPLRYLSHSPSPFPFSNNQLRVLNLLIIRGLFGRCRTNINPRQYLDRARYETRFPKRQQKAEIAASQIKVRIIDYY